MQGRRGCLCPPSYSSTLIQKSEERPLEEGICILLVLNSINAALTIDLWTSIPKSKLRWDQKYWGPNQRNQNHFCALFFLWRPHIHESRAESRDSNADVSWYDTLSMKAKYVWSSAACPFLAWWNRNLVYFASVFSSSLKELVFSSSQSDNCCCFAPFLSSTHCYQPWLFGFF